MAGFNSATAVTPWVTPLNATGLVASAALQFGHGGDAVGDAAAWTYRFWYENQLQFGHGGDAVGDNPNSCNGGRAWRLQFGHGGDAVGDPRHAVQRPSRWCFNSATAVTPWVTSAATTRIRRLRGSFNSATAVTPWVTTSFPDNDDARGSLQFGHGGDAVGDRSAQPGTSPGR